MLLRLTNSIIKLCECFAFSDYSSLLGPFPFVFPIVHISSSSCSSLADPFDAGCRNAYTVFPIRFDMLAHMGMIDPDGGLGRRKWIALSEAWND